MAPRSVIRSQFHAALDMLQAAIEACPDEIWDRPADTNRTWQLAYHTLFYTHLYLQAGEDAFSPWPKQQDHYRAMGKQATFFGLEGASGAPLDKAGMLEYLAYCRQQVDDRTAEVDLRSPESGFPWLPIGKLELQLYSLRHIMQHTGELYERLNGVAPGLPWVGRQATDEEAG